MTSRGAVLVFVGLSLLALTLGVSAVTAPDRTVTGSAAQVDSPDVAEPSVLIGSQGGGPEWKKHGRVYRVDGQRVIWNHSRADSNFGVVRLSDSRVVTGFLERGYTTGCGQYDSPCIQTGYRVIEHNGSDSPTVVEEFSYPVRTATHSENHDVEPLGDGRYLLADMENERILIVDDGTVTWQWNASSHYEAPADPTRYDWLHINDVDVLAEGKFLVSVRNANQLLVVERGEGVVDVINEDHDQQDDSCRQQLIDSDGDGDIKCGDPAVFDHQHNPQWLGNGHVLLADSENDRVIELSNQSGSWRPVWSVSEAGGIPLDWPRDADRLPNGNTIITDSLNKRVFIVQPDGTLAWSYATKRIPYEADYVGVGEPANGDLPIINHTRNQSSATSGDNTTRPTAKTVSVDSPNGVSQDPANDIPGLSILLVGVQALIPQTPFWFNEVQLGGTLLSFVLVAGGLLSIKRT